MSIHTQTSLLSLLDEASATCGPSQEVAAALDFLRARLSKMGSEMDGAPTEFDPQSPVVTADEMYALEQMAGAATDGASGGAPRWMLIHLSHLGLITPAGESYTLTPAGRHLLERHRNIQADAPASAPPQQAGEPEEDYEAALRQFASLPQEVRDELVALRPAGNSGMHPCARSHHEAMYLAADVHKVVVALHGQMRQAQEDANKAAAAAASVDVVTVTTIPVVVDFESTAAEFRQTVTSALIDAGAPMTDEEGNLMSVVDQIRWIAGLPSSSGSSV